jgi:hypothetical protein
MESNIQYLLLAASDVSPTQVGWPTRPAHKVAAALQNSFMVASLHLVVYEKAAVAGVMKAPESC